MLHHASTVGLVANLASTGIATARKKPESLGLNF